MIFLLIQKDRQLLGEETEEDWKAKEGYRVVAKGDIKNSETQTIRTFLPEIDTQVYAVKQAAPSVVTELILF